MMIGKPPDSRRPGAPASGVGRKQKVEVRGHRRVTEAEEKSQPHDQDAMSEGSRHGAHAYTPTPLGPHEKTPISGPRLSGALSMPQGSHTGMTMRTAGRPLPRMEGVEASRDEKLNDVVSRLLNHYAAATPERQTHADLVFRSLDAR